jgi:hypothetical protein
MATNQGPTTSYILSLIGGIIILLYSIVTLALFGLNGPYWGGFGGFMRGMMDGYHNFTGGYYGSTAFLAVASLVGLVCGVIVIIGAAMLRVRPQEHVMWGTLILIFAAISFVGMGGFFIGAILGIIGGAFAVSYRPKASRTETSNP